jgi:hypothetical protein
LFFHRLIFNLGRQMFTLSYDIINFEWNDGSTLISITIGKIFLDKNVYTSIVFILQCQKVKQQLPKFTEKQQEQSFSILSYMIFKQLSYIFYLYKVGGYCLSKGLNNNELQVNGMGFFNYKPYYLLFFLICE